MQSLGSHLWAGPGPCSGAPGGPAASTPQPRGGLRSECLTVGCCGEQHGWACPTSIPTAFQRLFFCVWLQLERRQLHFPDSLAAKGLAMTSVSPNRIARGDVDLRPELGGREAGLKTSTGWPGRRQGQHISAAQRFLRQWLPAEGSSFPGHNGLELGGWEPFRETRQGFCSLALPMTLKATRDLVIHPGLIKPAREVLVPASGSQNRCQVRWGDGRAINGDSPS